MVAIFVLAAFVIILLTDHLLLKLQGKTHPAFEPAAAVITLLASPDYYYELPSNVYLSKGHTWFKRNGEGLFEIGVDSLGARALGGLSLIKCASENVNVKRGDVLFHGNYGSETVEFLSPIGGTVKQINQKAIGNKITNPYGTWGIKISSDEKIDYGKELFTGNEAAEWIKNEFGKLKKFLEKNNAEIELVGETMFDGGASSGITNSTPTKNIINNFKKEFLSL